MGNTPSGDETDNKTVGQSTNVQNSNNPQGWQPPRNAPAPSANRHQPAAPGWSVPPTQQAYNKGREANAQTTPPTYDEALKTKQPHSPTAPQAPHFMPQQGHVLPSGTAQQYYAQPKTFPQAAKTNNPQFFAQPKVTAQQQPNKLYSQRPVTSGNKPRPTAEVPFNSAAMGLDTNIWVTGHQNKIPSNAFHAGHDTDGTPLFICRATHSGDVIPGKVVKTHSCAYISYGGKEHAKNMYEILIGDKYRWVHTGDGKILPNAVEGGRTGNGEKLYIGRANFKHSLTPGKIHPSHKCLYVPYGGQEKHVTSYEILVHA